MDFKLEDEITLMEVNNKDKSYGDVTGQIVVYKDDKVFGVIKTNDFEMFVRGKVVDDKIYVRNVLNNNYVYNLSDNIIFYNKDNILYKDKNFDFGLNEVEFDIKKVDNLNRKILDHKDNIDGMKSTTNRVLVLKYICTNI